MNEHRQIEGLETESRFILDYCSWFPERCVEPPPRFNNTTASPPYHPKDRFVVQGRILPKTEPYCNASFLIQMTLPEDYPFKIPQVRFIDPIYHPRIHTSGHSCCCFTHHLRSGGWSPARTLVDMISAVIDTIDIINSPSEFVRSDLGTKYKYHRQTFHDNALSYTLTYGRPRY